jgi:hypothetical protein
MAPPIKSQNTSFPFSIKVLFAESDKCNVCPVSPPRDIVPKIILDDVNWPIDIIPKEVLVTLFHAPTLLEEVLQVFDPLLSS